MDEQVAGLDFVDSPVVNSASGDEGNAVQRNSLDGHRRSLFGIPDRFVVGILGDVRPGTLGPFGLDSRSAVGPESVRFDEFAGHDPVRRLLGEHRAAPDHEPGVAAAHELAAERILETDVGEQSGEQRLVDGVMGRLVACGLPFHRANDPQELADDVLPFPDAIDVEELLATQLARTGCPSGPCARVRGGSTG